MSNARLLIVGKGPHRPVIENLVRELDLEQAVVWAGYHEEDLPEYFRAMNLMLFTAAGSDEGHRAISEANACGTPVATFPLPGVDYVLGDTAGDLVSREATPASLAEIAYRILSGELRGIEAQSRQKCFPLRLRLDRGTSLQSLRDQLTGPR